MIKKLEKEEALLLYSQNIERDFPPDEIPPYKIYQRSIIEGIDEVYVFLEEGQVKAYFVCRRKQDNILILFFAVLEQYRGKGTGTKALKELEENYLEKDNILLEVESEIQAKREAELEKIQRRIRFYERLGYKKIEQIEYQLRGVNYDIMIKSRNGKAAEEIIEILESMYEKTLRKKEWLKIKLRK